jgi:outer membrane biosynthesis protein TonB
MIAISKRDLFYSVILHGGLILMVTAMNPFVVRPSHDLESIGVNIISLPPLGNPDLVQGGKMPEIAIPQALVEDEVAIPISAPESKKEMKKVDEKAKPKETKHPPKPDKDLGYQGLAQKGDKTQKGGTDISDEIGPGSKFGSAAVDNASFDYPYYFVQAFGKIERNWSNPVGANQPLSCVVYFKIIRSGTIMDPVVETSSGVPAYDRACLRAVVASSPLPQLPTDFRDDIIGIYLEFPYKP